MCIVLWTILDESVNAVTKHKTRQKRISLLASRKEQWSHGVMVSTLDFESSDPSSSLGGTSQFFSVNYFFYFPSETLRLYSLQLRSLVQ